MDSIWSKFKAWLAAKGGALHVIVVVYVGAVAAYGLSPAFKEFVTGIWTTFPHTLQLAVLSVTQILAIYGIGSAAQSATHVVMMKLRAPKAVNHDEPYHPE